jgi:hypothetical protein
MPTLIACLSTGKGTWAEVIKIINSQPWDKVFLLTNEFGKQNFKGNAELVIINSDYQEVAQLAAQIKSALKDKISDFEVALNIASGTGREHMALLEAIMELGLNFRLISVDGDKVVVLGLEL